MTPPRCARNGCHHDQQLGLPPNQQLGLCTHHHTQYLNGTLGHDHNPRTREQPTTTAATTIKAIINTTGCTPTLRQIARLAGIAKDDVANILKHRYTNVRSSTFLQIEDSLAQLEYEKRHGIPFTTHRLASDP